MKTDLRAFLVAVATCVLIVLVVALGTEEPAKFTDRDGGSGLWRFIYDFQTLIAGLLAVLAAAATVMQMQLTDAASDERFREAESQSAERHDQLFYLTIRGDRLRLERALMPSMAEFKAQYSDAKVVWGTVAFGLRDISQTVGAIHPLMERISEFLSNPQFADGRALFDGDLASRVWQLEKRISLPRNCAEKFYGYRKRALDGTLDAETVREYERWLQIGDDSLIFDFIEYFVANAPHIIAGMERMAQLYDIQEVSGSGKRPDLARLKGLAETD